MNPSLHFRAMNNSSEVGRSDAPVSVGKCQVGARMAAGRSHRTKDALRSVLGVISWSHTKFRHNVDAKPAECCVWMWWMKRKMKKGMAQRHPVAIVVFFLSSLPHHPPGHRHSPQGKCRHFCFSPLFRHTSYNYYGLLRKKIVFLLKDLTKG